MQKPLYLNTDESLDGDLDVGGRGNDLWKISESAHTGDVNTVQELIDRDPNLVTHEYIASPLGFAVAAGNTEVAKLLLSHGASPCASLREHSLLKVAEIRGYSEIHQLLLNALKSRFNYSDNRVPWPNCFKQSRRWMLTESASFSRGNRNWRQRQIYRVIPHSTMQPISQPKT